MCCLSVVFRSALQQPGTWVRVITRELSQPLQPWRSSNMCFSSQHGITDVESLHNRYMEFARADHLVAKLCEVLKYHQKFDTHEEGEEFKEHQVARAEKCQAFNWVPVRKTQRRWVAW